jgi:hypothetical protein
MEQRISAEPQAVYRGTDGKRMIGLPKMFWAVSGYGRDDDMRCVLTWAADPQDAERECLIVRFSEVDDDRQT